MVHPDINRFNIKYFGKIFLDLMKIFTHLADLMIINLSSKEGHSYVCALQLICKATNVKINSSLNLPVPISKMITPTGNSPLVNVTSD